MATIDLSQLVTTEDKAAAQLASLQATYSATIQAHLDAMARERDYDDIERATTYRGDKNPLYAAEGQALFDWRSDVWTYATAELEKVKAGSREIPTVDAFLLELPVFEWPEIEIPI
ncbi:hypothetical protein C5748_18520 [Phyllobacterium phragmitis]|uniref:Uncharacterized protein n=1 Tax=Phyllobacterium phragmitis TaxID=2670329 RepID=A0A2S9INN9_9HYPH|nr:hypothetical protein [Phyllobacterium phragmitis]PRD42143.1 hypothetical protein C5748_18520 [Phyllobacterium phragmitis]